MNSSMLTNSKTEDSSPTIVSNLSTKNVADKDKAKVAFLSSLPHQNNEAILSGTLYSMDIDEQSSVSAKRSSMVTEL